jgi:hypothetical protein
MVKKAGLEEKHAQDVATWRANGRYDEYFAPEREARGDRAASYQCLPISNRRTRNTESIPQLA